MAGSTNKIRIELEGKDKSLGKTLRGAGKDASTFSGRLKLAGKGLKQLLHGDLKGLGKTMKTASAGMSGFAGIATAAFAAVAMAAAGGIVYIIRAKKAYESWMADIIKTQRLTGLSAESASRLNAQMQLSGVASAKAQTGLTIFAKGLDTARQGGKAMVTTFARLHVSLRDTHGRLRPLNVVLEESRQRLARIKDPATRAGIASKLFGRGFREMLPWITRSKEQIREFTRWSDELGLTMTQKAVKAFGAYRENQRKMSFLWQAIKVNWYAALVPLINKAMPSLIRGIYTAARWLGRFRNLVEKKGWSRAFEQMIPGGKKLKEQIYSAWNNLKKFGQYIHDHRREISAGLSAIARTALAIARALDTACRFADRLNRIVHGASRFSGGGGGGGGGGRSGAGDGIGYSPRTSSTGGGSFGLRPPSLGSPPGGRLGSAVWSWIGSAFKRLMGMAARAGAGPSVGLGGKGYGWANALAKRFGLTVTSSFRPGAITASGYRSFHATYGKAADLAGPPSAMRALFNYLVAHRGGIAEAIYQHQMIKNGVLMGFGRNDHFDHVHVARGDGVGATTSVTSTPVKQAVSDSTANRPSVYNFYITVDAADRSADEVLSEIEMYAARRSRGV